MKQEFYKVGDVVKKTPFYASTYPNWKADEGTVVSCKMHLVLDANLASTDKAFFRARYGTQPKYPIFQMLIKVGESPHPYLVSQFGFNKD